MQLSVFGGLRATRGGTAAELGRPKQRLVLTLLLIEANRPVPAGRIVELLWDHDGDKERAALHAYVSNLRKALEPDRRRGAASGLIVRDGAGYRLAIDRDQVDIHRFEDLVTAARQQRANDDRDAALTTYQRALALWTAPPLAGFEDQSFVLEATGRWRSLLAQAVDEAATLLLLRGDAAAAVAMIESRTGDLSLNEHVHELLALGLYRTGRQAESLRVIDDLRRALVDASGLELSPALRGLELQILDHAPSLAWTAPDQPGRSHPPPTSGARATPFVGRADEFALIHTALQNAADGRGGAIAISAPAGVGKTALVERFAAAETDRALSVAWARCPESSATPPFWPLRLLERAMSDHSFPIDALVSTDAAVEPFLIAAELARSLRATDRRMLLVIDDLQWADSDSLAVVTHLLADLATTRTVLIVLHRPLTADSSAELVMCLAELARHGAACVELRPLDEDEIGSWLDQRSSELASADLARELHARTNGNALFARELIELIASDRSMRQQVVEGSTRLSRVPPGISAVVRRRVAQLPADTQQLLSAASVIGTEFDVDTIADLMSMEPPAALRAMSPAIGGGFVTTDDDRNLRFSHSLVADALAAEVNGTRRADVHAAAARSLQRRRPGDDDAALVAHHAAAGASAGTASLAVEAARRAARHASSHSAHTDAARHWQLAADMLHVADPDQTAARVDALVQAARSWQRADSVSAAQDSVVAAMTLAHTVGDIARASDAAAVLNHASIFPNQPYGIVDHNLVNLLDGLVRAMPTEDSASRALVLSALTTELTNSPDAAWRRRASIEAVEMARRLDVPSVLARTLHARTFALKQTADIPARRDVARELADLATSNALGDDLVLVAELQVLLADFSLGNFDEVARRLPRCTAMLERPVGHALRSQLGFLRSQFEFVQGRHANAIAGGDDAFQLFRIDRPAEANGIRQAQRFMFGFDRGDLDVEVLEAVPSGGGAQGYALAFQLWAAALLFDLGHPDLAAAKSLPRGTVPERGEDYLTLFIDTNAALCAAASADVEAAHQLLTRLEPWSGRWVMAGTAAGSMGLVDLPVARLHAMLGNTLAAERWFTAAVEGHERLSTPAWLARSLLHHGRFLLATGSVDRATAALDRAGEVAGSFDLPMVAQQVRDALR